MELVIKKCMSCGAVVDVIEDCTCDNCGIKCCGEEMVKLVPNTEDAAAEKHVPQYEVEGEHIKVTLNHPMDEDHYIVWIKMVNENRVCTEYLKPGMEAKASFKYVPGSKLYAYCNKHNLWSNDVK